MWKSQRERFWMYGGCWSVSQPNLWSLSFTRLAVRGWALSCKRMIPSDSIPGRFDFMARRSILSQEETNHISLLFFACPHFQCWTNTLYTTLTSRAIKKQLCGPVRFHYACLLPYRWQYRYVTTVLPAFARNVFYGGWYVYIWLPLYTNWKLGLKGRITSVRHYTFFHHHFSYRDHCSSHSFFSTCILF